MTERAPGSEPARAADGLRPFDPLRAVTDVQRQAIDNAGQIIGRLLELTDVGPADRDALDVQDDGEGTAEPGLPQIRANVARAIDLYMDLFRRTFEAYADLTETALRRRAVSVGSDGASPVAPLTLQLAEDGIATGELWLHNATGVAIDADRVRATPLCSHAGHTIPVTDVTIDPSTVPAVPPGESTRLAVRVDTTHHPSGRYHGHLLTSRAALAVDLTVTA